MTTKTPQPCAPQPCAPQPDSPQRTANGRGARLSRIGRIALATSFAVSVVAVPVAAATKTTKKSSVTAKKGTLATKSKVSKTTQYAPNGRPPKPAAPFLWDSKSTDTALSSASSFEAATTAVVPNNKLFKLLIIGSDARPNEKFQTTRGDSIHIFVWNPAFNKGILVGIPRDSYVTLRPSGKKGKITGALSAGGPAGMLATVNSLSGLNIQNYVVTGFAGFTNMVNDIGGVNVLVDPAMKDVYSGAMFRQGWFAMNGDAALAFARNRKTVANGDFTRSANQGKFLLYTMAKLREEVSDVPGLVSWIASFKRNAASNLAPSEVLMMAQIARHIDPANIQNVVLSGKNAKVGKEDVVNLTPTYPGLFTDIGRDGVNDGK